MLTSYRSHSHPWALVGALTLLAAALRLFRLGYRALWFDEAMLWWVANGSASDTISRNAASNSAPPLHALLVHAVSLVNDSEAGLRAISALAGIAAVPAIYALARMFLLPTSALGSALVVSVAPTLVFYSQQLREYSLAFLLATLMLGSFVWFVRSGGWRAALALTLIWALGLGIQYGLALLALTLNLVFAALLARRQTVAQPRLLRWIAAQVALLGVAALVYGLALGQQMRAGGFAGDSYLASGYWDGSPGSLIQLIGHTWRLVPFAFEGWPPFLALLAAGVWYVLKRRQWLMGALCAAPIAVTFVAALARLYPYDAIRQTIYLAPMLYIVAGAGLEQLWALRLRPLFVRALLALIIVLGAVGSVQYMLIDYENTRPLIAALPALLRPSDQLYVHYGALPAYRYYTRHWAHNPALYGASDQANVYRQADTVLRRTGRVWIVFAHCNVAPSFRCQDLLDYVRRQRTVEPVLSASQTYLVLVHAAAGQ